MGSPSHEVRLRYRLLRATEELANKILDSLYERVVVPLEVCQKILTHSASRYGAGEFEAAEWLEKRSEPTETDTFLRSSLDSGEAAVIQHGCRMCNGSVTGFPNFARFSER